MRGVIVFVTGLLVISAIVLLSGVLLEPFAEVVAQDEAAQNLGWASSGEKITDTIQQWAPLFYIAYLLVWAAAWAFRRERTTARRM